MEERSPSQVFGTIASPDLSPTPSHIQDSQHDDTHNIRSSPDDSYAGEINPGASEDRAGKEPRGSELRDQQVLVPESSATHRGETDEVEGDSRSSFRVEETPRERRAAEYYGEEHTHRRSYRVGHHRSSSSTMRYRSRVSSERHRDRSESPRRRRRFDEYWYREEHEHRRRSLRPASLGYFLRRRYSSLSFAVSRSRSRSGVLYRRTQWQPARRAYDPVRSTQLDSRVTRLRRVPSEESVPRESGARYASAMSDDEESSRIIDIDPPVVAGANSETEPVIPKVPLAGYHLEDPRREDYAPGFRRDLHPQEHELVDLTVSTREQHYEARQLTNSRERLSSPSTFVVPTGTEARKRRRDCTSRDHRWNVHGGTAGSILVRKIRSPGRRRHSWAQGPSESEEDNTASPFEGRAGTERRQHSSIASHDTAGVTSAAAQLKKPRNEHDTPGHRQQSPVREYAEYGESTASTSRVTREIQEEPSPGGVS
ncbi:hypothetical protein MTO96_003968 [Rhipicephalus appendiculatus]